MGRLIEAKRAFELRIATSMVQDGTGKSFRLINPKIIIFEHIITFSGFGSAIKTATCLSSLPQLALQRDLFNSFGSSVNKLNEVEVEADDWQTILNDIKSSIYLNEESLKFFRISKLNNVSEWKLEEIKRERNDYK